ncbi:KinB-signaling pathway activation protein [Paenibacillus apii]|uniref:KinB-signaling pathway activation protein n=1 Tax=Paenibacillus apii TaxID=1850370 RepID=UPI002E27AA74|nr:KinB-signaling pathway activation protein [Paenibacillus apii]
MSVLNIKTWFHLFWTTLLIGSLGAVAAGLALQGISGAVPFKGITDFMLYALILFGYGMLVSVYSQLGFFAYLILNYMGFGVFPRKIWQYIQLVLALLALFDLFLIRSFVGGERSLTADLLLGLSILIAALAVAHFKVRDTNASAWIPTFFFMTGITIVELIGVLRIGVDNATLFIVVPLVACNAFQILRLHRILRPAAG